MAHYVTRFRTVGLCAVGLALFAGCTSRPDDGGRHARESVAPKAQEVSGDSREAREVREPLEPLSGDHVMVERSGSGRMVQPIFGQFGPRFHLYAKCVGDGALQVVDLISDYRWTVPCDGVPSRNQVVRSERVAKLQVSAEPGAQWQFLVARPTRG